MYKPSDSNEIGISYGKRISRPNYSWLNPSKSYYNKYSYFIGDVNLKPTITHNLSILYTLKSKYNFDLYYRNEKNLLRLQKALQEADKIGMDIYSADPQGLIDRLSKLN